MPLRLDGTGQQDGSEVFPAEVNQGPDETVISVRALTKRYALYSGKSDRLREALSLSGRCRHTEKEALCGVSFTIRRGECVGMTGLNGSGKSTLLKILSGVVRPTSGSVEVKGRVQALLELGAGFNPEYTGLENIRLSLSLQGCGESEIRRKIPEILAFAEIGEYAGQPVKTYSSGMFVRLAFAVAAAGNPDVLLIDEALSVGDIYFQQKCWKYLRRAAEQCTVFMVSHDMAALTRFCGRILLLDQGVLRFDGPPADAVSEYCRIRHGFQEDPAESVPGLQKDLAGLPFRKPERGQLSGRMEVQIDAFCYDIDGIPFCEYCHTGQTVHVALKVTGSREVDNLIVGYQVLDRFGTEVFGETSITAGGVCRETHLDEGQHVIVYSFTWPEIREGEYLITLGVGTGCEVLRQQEQCWVNQAIHLVSDAEGKVIYGVFNGSMRDFMIR